MPNFKLEFPPNAWKTFKTQLDDKLGKELSDKLNKALNREIADMRHHFKTNQWPLDYDIYKGTIIRNAFGPVDWLIMTKIVGKGFTLYYDTQDRFLIGPPNMKFKKRNIDKVNFTKKSMRIKYGGGR